LNSYFVESDAVDELAAAMRSFRADRFDAELIRKHAQRFSRSAFVAAMRSVVESLEAGDATAPSKPVESRVP